MIYDLPAIYDGAKSFYHKATITEKQDKIILTSYNTKILYLDRFKNLHFYYHNIKDKKIYSMTTLRHIKEFLKIYYYNVTYTKKDIEKLINDDLKEIKNNDK